MYHSLRPQRVTGSHLGSMEQNNLVQAYRKLELEEISSFILKRGCVLSETKENIGSTNCLYTERVF